MRIISIVILLAICIGATPAQAAEENTNTNINIKFELNNNIEKVVNFLVADAFAEKAEAQSVLTVEPEVAKVAEPKSPEEIQREKVLARWKAKQEHLWKKMPEGKFTINASAYTAAADECGKSDGITASGLKVKEKQTIACPPQFPFGAKIEISGYGIFVCEDRGGAIKGNKIDIYVETKKEAFAFGRRNLEAEVVL